MMGLRRLGQDGFHLKILAMVTMFLDHVAAILLSPKANAYLAFRLIGRLAFPIYCFLLVEGFFYTRNTGKYLTRLALFALLSEIPFNLAFYGSVSELKHQNTIFMLLLGFMMIYGMDYFRKRNQIVIAGGIFAAAAILSELLKVDYGLIGVLTIFIFYWYRERLAVKLSFFAAAMVLVAGGLQSYGALAAIPIGLYNGRKGAGGFKYFFYIFYPAHLLLLYGISLVV